MATVNLGRIKPVFRGAYDNSTAYVIDDIVTYQDETYIAITATTGNLPTVTANWTKLAAKGTDGTDVGTTITTQGDILYRDASGLARLGAGTSGQALLTQGAGANPIWGNTGGLVQTVYGGVNTAYQQGGTVYATSIAEATITPTSASNSILIFATSHGSVSNSNAGGTSRDSLFQISRDISGGATGTQLVESKQRLEFNTSNNHQMIMASQHFKDTTYNTTSAVTYKMQTKGEGGGWDTFWNQDGGVGMMILMEVSA